MTVSSVDAATDGSSGGPGNASLVELRERVREHWEDLSPGARRVAAALAAASVQQLLYVSSQALGRDSRTSGATVVRTLQELGYAGLPDLKDRLARSDAADVPAHDRLRTRLRHRAGGMSEVVDEVVGETVERVRTTGAALDTAVLARVCEALAGASGVFAYGVGVSSIAAEYLALKLARLGLATRHVAADGFRLADELLRIERGSALVVFAPGRLLRDIEVMFDRAAEVGAASVLITSELQDSPAIAPTHILVETPTRTGITHEVLTALVICDLIVHAVAQADQELALDRSRQLNALRARLGFS